jgi:hypothetical protein
MSSLCVTLAIRHSTQSCPIPERLPVPGTFAIEAKLGAIVDVCEFFGKPIEHPSVQFAMFHQGSNIVKTAEYPFVEIVFASPKHDPSDERSELVIAIMALQSTSDAMEMPRKLGQ